MCGVGGEGEEDMRRSCSEITPLTGEAEPFHLPVFPNLLSMANTNPPRSLEVVPSPSFHLKPWTCHGLSPRNGTVNVTQSCLGR